METYWPYGSPYPYTPGYQPVLETTDLSSKNYFSFKLKIELIKNESAGQFQYYRFVIHHQGQELGGRGQEVGPEQHRTDTNRLRRRPRHLQDEVKINKLKKGIRHSVRLRLI